MPLVVMPDAAPYRWADGLYTNGGMGQDAAHSAMERLTAETDTAWLIATEVDMWDERGLVQAWLEQNGSLADQAHFVGVSVYQFNLPWTELANCQTAPPARVASSDPTHCAPLNLPGRLDKLPPVCYNNNHKNKQNGGVR